MSKVGDMMIDKVPPACDGCDHPADKVDCNPHITFRSNDLGFRCRACNNYWLFSEGRFSNPLHISLGFFVTDPKWTFPDVDNRPPPRGGFF